MSADEFNPLVAKVRAKTASDEEAAAYREAFAERFYPEFAAAAVEAAAVPEDEQRRQAERAKARADRKYRKYQRRQKRRMTLERYSAILARRADRMRVDDVRLSRREALDRVTVCSRPMARRTPRSRRVVRRVASRDGPARQSDDPHDPDVAPRCPRCGHLAVVLRGVPVCGPCWGEAVLALEERAA